MENTELLKHRWLSKQLNQLLALTLLKLTTSLLGEYTGTIGNRTAIDV